MIPITAELAALAAELELANLRTRERADLPAVPDWLTHYCEPWTPEEVACVEEVFKLQDMEQLGNNLWCYWLDTYGQPL